MSEIEVNRIICRFKKYFHNQDKCILGDNTGRVCAICSKGGQFLCEICNYNEKEEEHHLIPVTCHSNKWFKKRFTSAEMDKKKINVCIECHDKIHSIMSEKELGMHYNTRELLLSHPDIIKFVEWVRRSIK